MSFTREMRNHIKNIESMAKSDDIIYFNLTMGVGQIGSTSVNATINASANTPIVEHPDEYYCSIVRLETPQLNIPLGYVHIVEPVVDINQTVYKFSLSYGSSIVTQNVQWICPLINFVNPPQSGTIRQTKSNYYFIESYQQFIDLWNTCLQTAYINLRVLEPTLPINSEPFFNYNTSTGTIELYGLLSLYDLNGVNPISIFFNGDLIPYMNGFSYYEIVNDPIANNLLNLKSNPNLTTALNQVQINTTPYLKISQEFTNGQCYWNTLRQIVLTTSMNIVQESNFSTSSPGLLSSGQNVQQLSILTDFYPDTTVGAGSCRSTYIYNASALWRLFQFNQKTPLYNISVSIYWLDQDGEIFPLTIFPGISPTIKFMFIKKHLIDFSQNGNIGRL